MNGGDLRFHISRKTFTEEAVRFWIAELGCALRYIHKQGIVHRDVKPDNVLLDSEGHIHLADFVSNVQWCERMRTNGPQNVASDFTPGKPLTSKSGTLAYLAPEVYNGNGYTSGADWWSLGVLFYECIYNKVRIGTCDYTIFGANVTSATIRRKYANHVSRKHYQSQPKISHYRSTGIDAMPTRHKFSSRGGSCETDGFCILPQLHR